MPETGYTTEEQIKAMRRVIFRAKRKEGRWQVRKGRGTRGAGKNELAIKITGWILFLAVILVLGTTLVSIHQVKNKGEIPELLGFQLYAVESGSMEPTFSAGTVILSRKPQDAGKLQEKEIITFRASSGSVVTHRIMEVLTDEEGQVSYRTKGDNPISSPDQDLLTPDRVIAVFLAKLPFT